MILMILRPPAPLRPLRGRPLGARPPGAPPLGPLGPRPPAARSPAGNAISSAFSYIFSHFAGVAIFAVFGAHLMLAHDSHPLPVRALTAVSAVLMILETRRYLREESRGELPFIVLALLQFYATFGFEIFWDLPFFDLSGPVNFTPSARLSGGLAAGFGALCLWGGAHVGLRLGDSIRPSVLRALPPARVPERWDDAFFVYAGLVIALWLVSIPLPNLVPQALYVPVFMTLSVEFALGLAIARPPERLGPRAADLLTAFGMLLGILRGQLEPIFRMGMAITSGRWASARRVSFRMIAAVVALFLVLQPVKRTFREQVWGHAEKTGQEIGFQGRVLAWENTLGIYFGEDDRSRPDDNQEAAISRLSELGSVMQAFEVVPTRVDYLYGKSFAQLLYGPIPRILWANKPVTREELTQRYAVIFGRQTDRGAQTTAIGMCVLVEGYWNFGWFGIILVCIASGIVVGTSQRLLSGEHWALRAIAVAQIATLTIGGTVASTYGSLFQFTVSRLAATWTVYGLAYLLSARARRPGIPIGLAARARQRG